MDTWMGNMFYRHQSIDVIDRLTYSDLKYWNEWHEIMIRAEKRVIKEAESKRNA